MPTKRMPKNNPVDPTDPDDDAEAVPMPMFRQPAPPTPTRHDHADPDVTTTTSRPLDDDQLDQDDERDWFEPKTTTGEDGSSPASTGRAFASGRAANVKLAMAGISGALQAAGGLVNARLSPDDLTWLLDENDVEQIAPPLARITARHAPMPNGGQATDVADMVEAVIGIIGYVMKNMSARAQARAARVAGPVIAPNDDGLDHDVPAPVPAAAVALPTPGMWGPILPPPEGV